MSNEDNIIDVEIEHLPAVADDDASNREAMEWAPNPLPSARRDAELAANPERRCVAHKRNGEQCRKYAIQGATVCRTHGGATQHVKNKARIRVENASNRLMGKLIQFAFDDTKPPDTQLRAIQNALDRAGLKPPAEVVLSPGEPKPYETVFDSIGTYSREESRAARGYTDELDIGKSRGDQPPGTDNQTPAPPPASAYPEHDPCVENGSSSEDHMPPPSSRPHEFDHHTQPQPPARHITGEAAMRMANRANQQIGALPPMPELESPHKRYPRPQ
ncbi:hypothetical protein [Mycobacteroides abscessus]|uniref:hypothetical protein n=1 Tax=Mycobacteroides abscessus TaxID=36809 RepID=UPI00026832C1|nr:hypothetical protein [Mycobacteroides abscessus]EIT93616.1 hypothetical protein MA4S0726RA_1796 [Mycobacteroides abscessus 4S-0726-RA]EIU00634.1 hypothetical protein MA4S0303_1123 [Mycobacteroides abscessus 4S-0303]EIU01636.1 hypothetical protein MA4S0726RB_0236 [Mycobacteroides abscessus 4S-0726-RB]EIV15387.1 hypothetical protein MA4S0206_0061 [Mycobacteroides abscessus 4S-0206]EIV51691.1 hypothetical protein MA4S0116R_0908 [Mycobacteroides abscessus 4S-0116-R]